MMLSELQKMQTDVISTQIKETIRKIEHALNYLEVYIYIIAVKEYHEESAEFSKLELLTQLKESGEKVFNFLEEFLRKKQILL